MRSTRISISEGKGPKNIENVNGKGTLRGRQNPPREGGVKKNGNIK